MSITLSDNVITKFLEVKNIDTEFQYGLEDIEYDPIADNIELLTHYDFFVNHITEELIESAMHPSRIQYKMSHFDDIELFFDSM